MSQPLGEEQQERAGKWSERRSPAANVPLGNDEGDRVNGHLVDRAGWAGRRDDSVGSIEVPAAYSAAPVAYSAAREALDAAPAVCNGVPQQAAGPPAMAQAGSCGAEWRAASLAVVLQGATPAAAKGASPVAFDSGPDCSAATRCPVAVTVQFGAALPAESLVVVRFAAECSASETEALPSAATLSELEAGRLVVASPDCVAARPVAVFWASLDDQSASWVSRSGAASLAPWGDRLAVASLDCGADQSGAASSAFPSAVGLSLAPSADQSAAGSWEFPDDPSGSWEDRLAEEWSPSEGRSAEEWSPWASPPLASQDAWSAARDACSVVSSGPWAKDLWALGLRTAVVSSVVGPEYRGSAVSAADRSFGFPASGVPRPSSGWSRQRDAIPCGCSRPVWSGESPPDGSDPVVRPPPDREHVLAGPAFGPDEPFPRGTGCSRRRPGWWPSAGWRG